MQTDIYYRAYQQSDKMRVASLMMELQLFHNLIPQNHSVICEDLDSIPQSFEIWVAINPANDILGFALLCLFPGPGFCQSLYLKELFVSAASRKAGIGKGLMQTVIKSAKLRHLRRIDWVTSKENIAAQNLYKSLGANADPVKLYFRLEL